MNEDCKIHSTYGKQHPTDYENSSTRLYNKESIIMASKLVEFIVRMAKSIQQIMRIALQGYTTRKS